MRRQLMMVLASAALAGSLLATDAQARGGGGHGGGGHGGGGVAHVGRFGGAHIGLVSAAQLLGLGEMEASAAALPPTADRRTALPESHPCRR